MGPGETYWHRYVPWFKSQGPDIQAAYVRQWPEPDGWEGFYAFVDKGVPPPWLLERRQLTEAAAIPPRPDEAVIADDYHRILWPIRMHMRRSGIDALASDESVAERHDCPDGARWRLSASTA